MSPRTGRPKAEKPKTIEVKARIDEETIQEEMYFWNTKGKSRPYHNGQKN